MLFSCDFSAMAPAHFSVMLWYKFYCFNWDISQAKSIGKLISIKNRYQSFHWCNLLHI